MLKNSLQRLLEISLMISPLIIFIFLLRKNILRRLGPTARLLLWLPLIIQLDFFHKVQHHSAHRTVEQLIGQTFLRLPRIIPAADRRTV